MRNYTPRRFGSRWSEGAPAYVLDVFDNRADGDSITCMFTFPLVSVLSKGKVSNTPGAYSDTYIPYLGMSNDLGVSQWGEMPAFQAQDFRRHNQRHRIKWLDLPEQVRKHVIDRCRCDGCGTLLGDSHKLGCSYEVQP